MSARGFWILLDDRELFLPFRRFPWFRRAAIDHLLDVERPRADHLRWPDLDIDLTVDSIEHPERYPLLSKARPGSIGRAADRANSKRPGRRRDA